MSKQDINLIKAIELIRDTADPQKIILFGSRARGSEHTDSDFDIMVVKKDVQNRRKETVSLLRLISQVLVNVDLILVSDRMFNTWKAIKNSVYYEATKDGKILYEKTA